MKNKPKNQPTIDIYSLKGTKVIFAYPDNGYEPHQITAQRHLIPKKTYTVDYIYVGGWHTDIYLQEIPDVPFNSVMFKPIKESK